MKKLRPHQTEALERIRNGSVVAGGVGTGKSLLALAYYVQKVCEGSLTRDFPPAKPTKLIIITTAKKRNDLDWEGEGCNFGVFRDPETSYTKSEMLIDSWNNIKKYEHETDAFFIFDEQRVVGDGAWVKSFLKITKHNQWIMLSATPADTWMDYAPLFLAHGFFRTRSEFLENHVIWVFKGRYRQIRGFYGVRHLERLRDSILVEVPYDRHTIRHLVAVPVLHDVDTFDRVWKKRWNVFDDVPLIDVAEMHRVGRKVVNSDPSRLDEIVKLGKKHPRMIIYYTFDYELEALRTLGERMGITVAEWNGHKHESVPETDNWLYLVQYQAGAEGWNCTRTDAIVFHSLTYSHKLFEQAQGRIDRLDTKYVDLYYYILISDSKIDKLIWKAIVAKKNFHEGRNLKFKAA